MKSNENRSRRLFLKSLVAFAGLAAVAPSAVIPSERLFDPEKKSFELLVAGDSLVWGQGLREADKSYSLVKNWLEREIFGGRRTVNLKVKAHSGARLELHEDEAAALFKSSRDAARGYYPEINVSFPSIRAQLEAARREYARPESVDLVMLSGGIADITVAGLLNPFKDDEKLRRDIERYCRDGMFALLRRAADAFPNARFVVLGYYPIITRHTPLKKIVNDVLELYDVPRWLKPLVNTPLKRRIMRRGRGRMIRRSSLWHEHSTIALKSAVARLNAELAAPRALFAELRFGEENGYGASRSLLWKIAARGRAADALAGARKEECRATLDELRAHTRLKFRTRVCELASIGHPNVEGARAIADAVKENLKPLFRTAAEIE